MMRVNKPHVLLLSLLVATLVLFPTGCDGGNQPLHQLIARQQARTAGLTTDLFVAGAIAFALLLVALLFLGMFWRERSISKSLRDFIQKEERQDERHE